MLPAYKRFTRILERKRRELDAASHDRIHAVRAAGEIDDKGLGAGREMATADPEWWLILTRQIADALTRIDHDEYGLCVRCGAEIAVVRLHSIPWTPYCAPCQAIAELEPEIAGPGGPGNQARSNFPIHPAQGLRTW